MVVLVLAAVKQRQVVEGEWGCGKALDAAGDAAGGDIIVIGPAGVGLIGLGTGGQHIAVLGGALCGDGVIVIHTVGIGPQGGGALALGLGVLIEEQLLAGIALVEFG